jgi:hypothetical protein
MLIGFAVALPVVLSHGGGIAALTGRRPPGFGDVPVA